MPKEDIVPPPEIQVYNLLPVAVRETLRDSYQARVDRRTDSCGETLPNVRVTAQGNLANLWWGGPPSSFWNAVERIADVDLNMIVIVWERCMALSPAIWANIQWIRNMWVGSSAGFFLRYRDRWKASAIFDAAAGVCRDDEVGGADHRECHTWREVKAHGGVGLHLLVGKWNRWDDQIHLDWSDPAEGVKPNRVCSYNRGWKTVTHFAQVYANVAVETSPFLFPDVLASIRRYLMLLKTDPKVASIAHDQEPTISLLERTWAKEHRRWACEGQAGWTSAKEVCSKAEEIEQVLKRIYLSMVLGTVTP